MILNTMPAVKIPKVRLCGTFPGILHGVLKIFRKPGARFAIWFVNSSFSMNRISKSKSCSADKSHQAGAMRAGNDMSPLDLDFAALPH
ncbi:hypothetical protein DAH55_17790 [Sphingomonas koreensis]|nr:hypothetical protein DAH56_18165 [Sphingomonas koreensis]RSU65408.1 hypothetical protein DAH55_17790 [Sphingomonas koreensis]